MFRRVDDLQHPHPKCDVRDAMQSDSGHWSGERRQADSIDLFDQNLLSAYL